MALIAAPLSEIVNSIYGTFRLAQGDGKAMAYFNTTPEGFWRSFTAAALIAPAFVILLWVRYVVSDGDIDLARYASIHSIAYVMGWAAFPLLIFYLTDILGNGHRAVGYLVVYNWASVLQNLVYLPFVMLVEGHMVSGPAASVIGTLLLSLVFFYIWFITKTALHVSNFMAFGFVVIDFMLSVFLNSISQGMLRVT